MSYEVLLLGLLVGAANYCFRYLPLRLRVGNARPTKRGAVGILLDTIGIASICALLRRAGHSRPDRCSPGV